MYFLSGSNVAKKTPISQKISCEPQYFVGVYIPISHPDVISLNIDRGGALFMTSITFNKKLVLL